jgi:phosphoglycolate phosphatase-like HAD superfamily hydrolase
LEHAPRTPRNWHWRTGPVAPGPSVIFDVDGVLADASGRQHLLEWPQRDWDAFFDACGDDPVIDEVARMLSLLDKELIVVLLDSWGKRSRIGDANRIRKWLEKNIERTASAPDSAS